MESLSPLRRVYYAYLSRAYTVMYVIHTKSFLGISFISVARWVPVILLALAWFARWPIPVVIFLALLVVWINYSLWRARRDNFNRFVPDTASTIDYESAQPLHPNQKVAILATGLFSLSGRDRKLLLSPASYWRVPLGEHVVMAEELPGKYLYQFFRAETLQSVRPGWLLFGRNPIETLAVTFFGRWGPEYTRFDRLYEDGDDSNLPPPKRVTIYLSSDDAITRQTIWQAIVNDAQQLRLNLQ